VEGLLIMCGIGGWLGLDAHIPDATTRMLQALRHRGPDEYRTKQWPFATLVHARLSIIDLSPTGSQPMSNEDQTIWAIFNGEIYNHRELRNELQAKGHTFNGHSDSEVLTHLYEEYGNYFVSRLRGMFSVAILDTKSRVLVLVRDRLGIKPLFYASSRGRLAFASEIGALLELPGIDD
jgi:asparagine synthase (glutamine-hydrolysing)